MASIQIKQIFMVFAVNIEQNLSLNITMMTQLFLSYHHGVFSSIFSIFFEMTTISLSVKNLKIQISSHFKIFEPWKNP